MSESLRKTIQKETYFKIMELKAKYKCTSLQDLLIKMEDIINAPVHLPSYDEIHTYLKVFYDDIEDDRRKELARVIADTLHNGLLEKV